MRHSENFNEVAAALSKAQGAIVQPVKNKTADVKSDKGGYSYNYADLSAVLDSARKPLADNGLAIVSAPDMDERGPFLDVRVLHTSGQWIGCIQRLNQVGRQQDQGAELTYKRRYAAAGLLAIAAEDDDDANARDGKDATTGPRNVAKGDKPAPPQKQKEQQPAGPVMDLETFKICVGQTFTDCGFSVEASDIATRNALAAAKIDGLEKLAPARRMKFIESIKKGTWDRFKQDGNQHPERKAG